MNPYAAIRALNTLDKNKGWQYLQRVMEEEIVASAMAIAEKTEMSADEINFRRGTIWAARQMLSLPERARIKLENQIALDGDDRVESNIDDVSL